MTLAMDLGEDEGGHLAPRREFNPFAPVRANVLHCFGVDFMSTKEVLAAFAAFEPETIEWLDDSSCNLVFKDAEMVAKVLEEFGLPREPEDPWTRTKPVPVGSVVGKAKLSARDDIQLHLRAATEEDRKDIGHSGHTDSVYYAHVKEQQALQKQRKEMAQLKKRQRRSRLPVAEDTGANAGAVPSAMDTADPATSSVSAPTVDVATEKHESVQQAAISKLGGRGLLDPLLFLRAPGSTKPQGVENSSADLRTMLQQAEAEYAAIPGASQTPQVTQQRGRQPRRSSAKALPNRAQPPQHQDRGKKRRPVSQEPRPVSAVAPPPRKVSTFPQVEEFLKDSNLRCQKFVLQKTFRSIQLGQQKKPKAKAPGEAGDAAETKPVKKLPAWEEYFCANSNFIRQGQFMYTVAFDAAGRRVLAVVPHPKRVSLEHMAKAVQVTSVDKLKQLKLNQIEKETGFPVFVCPPFGHPKDSQGRPPLLLVDSSIHELKKGRPLLFDCGSVGLSVMPQEFVSIARAVCVEGLAKDAEAQNGTISNGTLQITKVETQPGASNADEAMNGIVSASGQDAKVACAADLSPSCVKPELSSASIANLLPSCVKPELSSAVVEQPLAEVQQPVESLSTAGDETMKS